MSIGFYTEEELRELPFDLPSDLDIEREINRYVPPVCGGLGLFDIDLLDCTCDVDIENCYAYTYSVGDAACGDGLPADFAIVDCGQGGGGGTGEFNPGTCSNPASIAPGGCP